jgi:general secretion pathway protein D
MITWNRMVLAALAALFAFLPPATQAQNPPEAAPAPAEVAPAPAPAPDPAPVAAPAPAPNPAPVAAPAPVTPGPGRLPVRPPIRQSPVPAAPAEEEAPLGAPASESGEKMLSLKFSDSPLEMVLDRYSELTGRTILMAPGIKVNITLSIEKRVTVPQAISAIEAVLAMNNIALVNEGDLFTKVVQINTVRQEGDHIRIGAEDAALDAGYLVTEIIPLKHIELADAQAAIATVVHPYANIQILPRINSLFVTDTAVNIERVKQLLAVIDQPVEMKEELYIIRILNAKASDIKARLSEIIAETEGQQKAAPAVVRPSFTGPPGVIRAGAAPTVTRTATTTVPDETKRDLIQGQVRLVADDRANILIIITRPENMEFFNKIVQAIDIGIEPDVGVKVIRLEYADATEVEGMLSKLIGATKDAAPPAAGGAPGQPGAAQDGTAERSAELGEYVRQLQQQRAAAAAAATAAATTTKSNVGELSATTVKILSDKRSNAIIIMASKGDMAALEDVIKDMDIMLSQVLIEAVILSVTLDKQSETGVDWIQRSMIAYEQNGNSKDPLFAFTGGTAMTGITPINALNTPSSFPGSLTYYMTFFDFNLDTVIRLSASDSRVRIISSPVILTTDNKKADIDISSDIYVYKGQKPVSAGDNVEYVEDVERIAVGTTLTVTPRINKNKFVVMDIEQKIEDISGQQAIPNQGTWPIVSRRKMSASIAVTSGDTIMLGGLTKKTERNTVTKIPFLGDIPILGIPFRNTDKEDQRDEVIVFITPYVLDTPEDIRADGQRRKDAVDVAGLWKRGWSASKLADPAEEEGRLAKIRDKLLRRQAKDQATAVPAPQPAPVTPPPG